MLVEQIARKSEQWLAKMGYEWNEDLSVEYAAALPLLQEVSISAPYRLFCSPPWGCVSSFGHGRLTVI